MTTYLPEGYRTQMEGTAVLNGRADAEEARSAKRILEARAVVCDLDHNLIVDLGGMKGVIPREECAIGIREGTTRDIAIIAKVNKPVCFRVTEVKTDGLKPYAVLSRRAVQEECRAAYIDQLAPGDIVRGRVTHMESFGCFVDIGCGVIALLPIDMISVSRISHPKDRFFVGQNILAAVKSVDENGRISLTHKELLGTWEENAARFSPGETVAGVVRSIEPYGIFVELAPNLAGLAELKSGVRVGQQASVYIKSLIPERMKVKLVLVDAFDAEEEILPALHYFITGGHIEQFVYSPEACGRKVETVF